MRTLKFLLWSALLVLVCSSAANAQNQDSRWLVFSTGQNGEMVKYVNFQKNGKLYFRSDGISYEYQGEEEAVPYNGGAYMYFSSTEPQQQPDLPVIPQLPNADYALYSVDQNVRAGAAFLFPVYLDNIDDIVSCQCDIAVPEGIEIIKTKNKYNIIKSDRFDESHAMSSSLINGKVRVVCMSWENIGFLGNSGVLFSVEMEASEDLQEGDQLVVGISNVVITREADVATGVKLPDSQVVLTVGPSYYPGDVNNDGEINVSDVSLAIAFVLGKEPANAIREAADPNGDGEINVSDVSMIISFILKGQTVPQHIVRRTKSQSEHYTDDRLVYKHATNSRVALSVDNIERYISAQFDVVVPEGASIQDLALENAENHQCVYAPIGENTYRVVAFSAANSRFNRDSAIDIEFLPGRGEIPDGVEIRNAMFVGVEDNTYITYPINGAILGTDITGIENVSVDPAGENIFNIKGQKVGDAQVPGFYIINNSKVFVK